MLASTCAVAGLVASCNLNSADDGKTNVSTYTEMPPCGGNLGTSGSDITGAKLYVEDEEANYVCTDSGWVVESVSTFDMLPLCTEKGRMPTLGQKVYVQKDSSYFRCLKSGWAVTAAEDSDDELTPVLDNRMIRGSVSAIGPFALGTSVELSEIYTDARTDSVLVSDSVYAGSVSMKLGTFVVPNVVSYSDYMSLKVKGLFMDPLTGAASEDSLELQALIDINKDVVSVGIGDFLKYKRIMVLANKGYKIEDAVVRADKELLDVFGFKGAVDEDAANLAISLLLRSNLEEGDFVEILQNFADDFAEDGVYDDAEMLTALADFAYNIENLKIKDEESGELLIKESDYRRNLEAFGVKDAAAFEAYFTNFWIDSYGLGGCGASRQDAVVMNKNEQSDSASAYFTCDNDVWRTATDFERDTVFLGNAVDGEIKAGNVNDKKMYVFDTLGIGAGNARRWKEPDSIVLVIGKSCTDDEKLRYTVTGTKDEDDNDNYYACVDRKWNSVSSMVYKIGYECHGTAKNVVERYKDSGAEDGYAYARCHETKMDLGGGEFSYSYIWLPTDEINYKFRESECDLYSVFSKDKKHYVCDDDDNVNFREANDDEIELGVCRKSLKDAVYFYKVDGDRVYRVCQEDQYQAGKWKWNATDKVTYETKKICSAETIGTKVTSDDVDYTCGCSMYDADLMKMVTVTVASKCGAYPIQWQKD